MARHLRLGHREPHVREEAALAAVPDVRLGFRIRLRARRADDVESELRADRLQLLPVHGDSVPAVKAIRIHEDGGPEVLRYEDAPDPVAGPGEVLVALRAASLNHLDLWVRKGLPSVPKPRILGADGAGIRVDTGERVVINPGLEHGDVIRVVGEHRDGTHAELVAVPEENVYSIPESLSFVDAAAFPLVFETSWRMLVTKAALQPGEWVLIWGIGGGVATASLGDREGTRCARDRDVVLRREALTGARARRGRDREPRDRGRLEARQGADRRRRRTWSSRPSARTRGRRRSASRFPPGASACAARRAARTRRRTCIGCGGSS